MAQGQWYYCLKHHAVEPYDGCKNEDRLGPYENQTEAANALQTVQERNDQWDHDPRWNDDEDDPDHVDDNDGGWGPFKS